MRLNSGRGHCVGFAVADMSHELPDLVARWLLLNRSNAADAAGRCRYRADTSRDIATQREKRSCIG